MPILNIKHKGIRRLYEEGSARGINADFVDKLENMLQVIDQAENVEDIDLFPGWRLHSLKGDLEGFWSLTISGNWRLIFRFEDGDASDLDLIDYH